MMKKISLLSSNYSTYEAVLDPVNKIREVMTVFPPIWSRQLTMTIQFGVLALHNILFATASCRPLPTSNAILCSYNTFIQFLTIVLPNDWSAQRCGM